MAFPISSNLSTSLEGVRLALLTIDDADEYFDLIQANRDHLTQHGDYVDLFAKDRRQIAGELAGSSGSERIFGIVVAKAIVGSVALIRYTPETYGIGYWISSDCEGRGYVTACCDALISAAKSDLGAKEMWAGITHGNRASIAVVTRLGFELAREQSTHLSFLLRLDA